MKGALQRFASWRSTIEAELLTATSTGDLQQLARVLHTMRGALAQLHADSIVELIVPLEKACKARAAGDASAPTLTVEAITPLLSRLKALTAEVTHYVASH